MKVLLLLLLSLSAFSQNTLQKINSFGSNPGNLEMFLHIPKNLSGKKPLVVVLHGCNQSAASISRISGWDELADQYGFYVLYPQQKFINNVSNCFHFYHPADRTKDQGEAGSIRQMMDYAFKNYEIDSAKIFVYGVSAGGAMATVMLVDYPQLFSGGAVIAGGPYGIVTNSLDGLLAMERPRMHTDSALVAPVKKENPDYQGSYPRLIVIHGRNDAVVDFKNGTQLIRQWQLINGCDTLQSTVDSSFTNKKDIIRIAYPCKDDRTKIVLYAIDHLSHRLPVDPGTNPTQGGETGLFAVDIDFFSTYYICKDLGIF